MFRNKGEKRGIPLPSHLPFPDNMELVTTKEPEKYNDEVVGSETVSGKDVLV
jgi:hypothetical protein